MKQTVLTIEQMKRLEKLGIDTSKASCCHYKVFYSYDFGDDEQEIWRTDFLSKYGKPSNFEGIPDNDGANYAKVKEVIPAFTLQDILELLPKEIELYGINCELTIYPKNDEYIIAYKGSSLFIDDIPASKNILESAYNALIWCLRNGYAHLIIK